MEMNHISIWSSAEIIRMPIGVLWGPIECCARVVGGCVPKLSCWRHCERHPRCALTAGMIWPTLRLT